MLTTLYDGLRDVGYCNQRGEIAGHASDRALLLHDIPLVVEGPAPPNARAILYRSATAALYWSPRSKDGLALYLTPIGFLIERYGLTAAAPAGSRSAKRCCARGKGGSSSTAMRGTWNSAPAVYS